MKPFRFRAQAALQLRRREHDHALAHLARAETALTTAQRRVGEADIALRDAEAGLRTTMQTATAHTRIEWYRSWRVRLCAERDQRDRQRRTCEDGVRDAVTAATRTKQRVRSLERLHEHALSAWQQAASQEERKTMDDIAAIRFTRGKDAE